MVNFQKSIAKFIVTLCFVGKIRSAPGTIGSFLAFPLHYAIMHFVSRSRIIFSINGLTLEEQCIITLFIIETLVIASIFCVGIYYINIYINCTQVEDPKEVIIDELVGQMLTITLVFTYITGFYPGVEELYSNMKVIYFIIFLVLPFVLFRLFDIVKPWPISWFDKNIKSAFGVMIDDIIAALFAVCFHITLTLFISHYFLYVRQH